MAINLSRYFSLDLIGGHSDTAISKGKIAKNHLGTFCNIWHNSREGGPNYSTRYSLIISYDSSHETVISDANL